MSGKSAEKPVTATEEDEEDGEQFEFEEEEEAVVVDDDDDDDEEEEDYEDSDMYDVDGGGDDDIRLFYDPVGKEALNIFEQINVTLGKLLTKNTSSKPVLYDNGVIDIKSILQESIESCSSAVRYLNEESTTSSSTTTSNFDDNICNEENSIIDDENDDDSNDCNNINVNGKVYNTSKDKTSITSTSKIVTKDIKTIFFNQDNNSIDDEWDDDDDIGCILVEISDEVFFRMEEEIAGTLGGTEDIIGADSWITAASSIRRRRSLELQDISYNSNGNELKNVDDNNISYSKGLTNEEGISEDEKYDGMSEDLDVVEEALGLSPTKLNRSKNDCSIDQISSSITNGNNNNDNTNRNRGRPEISGQSKFCGVDNQVHGFFNLKVIFNPYKTGFEESKNFNAPIGTIIAGRYEVCDFIGTAAFSSALQCLDVTAQDGEDEYVCLKVIKNNKDFFDQSLDEIKLLQYINSMGDTESNHILRLLDYFYTKEHLFIVSELLKQNLYEFGRHIRENMDEPYFTFPRLKKITKQVLEALNFIHSLNLIHCDLKPENIVMKSYSRCEIKLIDFGSSCFQSDSVSLTTYIQSRSYRAPEVILGCPYDNRIDVWSLGGVLAELHTGYVLFQNDSIATMLSRITGILGNFPDHVLSCGKDTAKYFTLSDIIYDRNEEGKFMYIYPKKTSLQARLHLGEVNWENERDNVKCNERKPNDDEIVFLDFIKELLNLDPYERVTAEEALLHRWFGNMEEVPLYPRENS